MVDIYTASVDAVALTAATTRTIAQLITPATTRALLLGIDLSCDGVTAGAIPLLLQLSFQSTAGTSVSLTPVLVTQGGPATSLVTALQTFTSTEPTLVGNVYQWRVTPYGGFWSIEWSDDRAVVIPVSSRIALRATAAAGVNVTANLKFKV
jgi:hypothetical protein